MEKLPNVTVTVSIDGTEIPVNEKTNLSYGSETKALAMAESEIIMPVNRVNLPIDWEIKNDFIIVIRAYDKFYVDLSKITDELQVADWLMFNDEYIDFDSIHWFIEYVHIIRENLDEFKNNPDYNYYPKTLEELKRDIDDSQIHYSDHYDKYIKFSIDQNNLNIEGSDFNRYDNLYSITLIRSILKNHDLEGKDPVFEFSEIEVNGEKTFYFRVKAEGKIIGFYDFSHKPPRYAKFL